MATALIVLAAGKGTRMESDLPKVLHPLAGAPLLWHALRAGSALEPSRSIVVVGHGADAVTAAAQEWDPEVCIALQDPPQGTAHAVLQAAPALDGFDGDAVVLYGDTPFLSEATLQALLAARTRADVVVLGFDTTDPTGYGRLVMEGENLLRIVEQKDASAEERAITLCNSGVLCADATLLTDLVGAVGNANAAGEYYLTDVVGLTRARGLSATAVRCDAAETLGINSRAELAAAEAAFQHHARAAAIADGVRMPGPDTVFLAFDTALGGGALVEPFVVFGPGVTVESDATIRAFSHLEGCHVSRGATVGPFARLRPGAELSEDVHIGNFVEIKNAIIGEGAKINHLSYVGDATVGEATNIGAGTVTCNYDGVAKHRTEIGARAFVGSATMLVAPVRLGDGSMTGSGSVITEDVPAGALAVSRARQVTKPGLATRLMDRLRASKRKG